MIIIVKQDAKEERVRDLIQWIEAQNLRTHVSKGDYATIIGVIGDISKLDDDLIAGQPRICHAEKKLVGILFVEYSVFGGELFFGKFLQKFFVQSKNFGVFQLAIQILSQIPKGVPFFLGKIFKGKNPA